MGRDHTQRDGTALLGRLERILEHRYSGSSFLWFDLDGLPA